MIGQSVQSGNSTKNLSVFLKLFFMYKDRWVVPKSLRETMMEILHSAHQGRTGMVARANTAFWWPNMGQEIERFRLHCTSCQENMPSQPKGPPVPIRSPEYPMQILSSDIF